VGFLPQDSSLAVHYNSQAHFPLRKHRIVFRNYTSCHPVSSKHQAQAFERKFQEIEGKLRSISITNTEVKAYKAITINASVKCEEALDVVKSIFEFDGKQESYVSWRQAANASYIVFKPLIGSSRHYQAVAIIRNKIRGNADAVLPSFNTVLNFEAILARLSFTYADKIPVRVIQQELDTMRQGELSLKKYYDEIEKKLTLLTRARSCRRVE